MSKAANHIGKVPYENSERLESRVESSDHAYLAQRMPTQTITRARILSLSPSVLISRIMLRFQALHAPFMPPRKTCYPCGCLLRAISDARNPQLSYPPLSLVGASIRLQKMNKKSVREYASTLLARLENETRPRSRPLKPFKRKRYKDAKE